MYLKYSYSRDKLHEGVIRDVERQQRQKRENMYNLQQQIELTKQFKKTQLSVTSDVT